MREGLLACFRSRFRSGVITRTKLYEIQKLFLPEITERQHQLLLDRADWRRDGRIDIEDPSMLLA